MMDLIIISCYPNATVKTTGCNWQCQLIYEAEIRKDNTGIMLQVLTDIYISIFSTSFEFFNVCSQIYTKNNFNKCSVTWLNLGKITVFCFNYHVQYYISNQKES